MDWVLTPYAVIMFFTAALTAAVGLYTLRFRQTPGGLSIVLMLLALTEWSFTTGIEYMAVSVPAKIFWSKIEYVGTVYAPVCFVIFAFEYTRQNKWLTPRLIAFLCAVPTLIMLLAWTNEWHHLIWTSFTPSLVGNNLLVYGHGLGLWIGVIYFYLIILVGIILLVRLAIHYSHFYRRQAIVILIASIVPVIGNLIYMLDLSPMPGVDLSLISFALTGTLLATNIIRFRMFEIMPIARDALIENMTDGVVVVDQHNRVIDMNPAALRLLNRDLGSVIGEPARTALAPWQPWVDQFIDTPQAQAELTTLDVPPRHIDLRITPLRDRHAHPTGRLIVLRDVTEFKQAEQTLHQRIEELTILNSIAQTLAKQTHLDSMIQSVGDNLRQMLNANTVFISLYNSQTQIIETPYWHVFDEIIQIKPIPLGQGLVSHVLRNRQPLIINSNYPQRSAELGVIRHTMVHKFGLPKSWLGIPMIVGDQLIGAMGAHNFDKENAFTETDVQLWTTIAAAVGAAIRNAQLYAETQRAAEQMTALNRISLAVTEGLAMERLLPTLHEQCKQIAPTDIFYVALYDQATHQRRFVYFADRDQVRSSPPADIRITPGLTGYIIETRQTLFISDTLDANQPSPAPIIRTGGDPARTFLGVPLILRDQVVGVISMQSYTPNAFTPQQIRLFEMFAVQAAIVVQNSQLYEQVQNLAITDDLTQLPNRRALFDKGEYEIMRARRFNHPFSVIMIDIDHFKQVNDQFGHAVGDQVLRQIAGTFRDSLRATDLPARYGGEEFVVLLPETNDQTAFQIAERMRAQIAQTIAVAQDQKLSVTVSLGVAMFAPSTIDFSKIISHADQALYRSKNNGRNCTTIWSGENS